MMNTDIEQVIVSAVHVELPVARAINKLMLETWPQIAQTEVGTTDFIMQRWLHYAGPAKESPRYHLLYLSGELVALAHSFGRTIACRGSETTIMGSPTFASPGASAAKATAKSCASCV